MSSLLILNGNAAAPLSLTPQVEVHQAVVQRTTASFPIDNFHLYDGHVCTIGLEAFRVLHDTDLQMVGLADGLHGVTAQFPTVGSIADRLQSSGS